MCSAQNRSADRAPIPDLDSVPDRPAVFLLWAGEGAAVSGADSLLRRPFEALDFELATARFNAS